MPERCPECSLLGGHLPGCSRVESASQNIGPHRDGCLTAWLIGMVVLNAINAIATALMFDSLKRSAPGLTHTAAALMCLGSALNVGFAFALLRWKRWGFYGLICSAILAFAVNLSIGTGLGISIMGLCGIAIVWGLLNLGGEHKAWRHLK